MTVAEFMEEPVFGFKEPVEFVRQRAVMVLDPYDPDAPGVPDWSVPDEITVYGSLASGSSLEQSDPVRAQAVSSAVLVLDDPDADVQRGDRIVQGARVWTVAGFPEADVNPFTGWQPTRVCSLEEAVG